MFGPDAQRYRLEETFALEADAADPLRAESGSFFHPLGPDGKRAVYLCGHSLGLQPRAARDRVAEELEDWARLGVGGHLGARRPWLDYHARVREPLARLVGARPSEVVAMNGLTVNLHLMMVSFYRPTPQRYKILIEDRAFPSDRYAVASQLRFHGFDPADGLLVARGEAPGAPIPEERIEEILEREGERVALVLLGGVNFFTGQAFDIARLTAAAARAGCTVGWDLAHAVGNVPLALHDWGADFAVWCSYKYLNAGPGAVAGCFVHERHLAREDLPRFAGWWGHDLATRFATDRTERFVPLPSADGWQLSNPPILACAPLLASLEIFDRWGMEALRAKSVALTGYLEFLLQARLGGRCTLITPREPERRGCQLSLRVRGDGQSLAQALAAAGVVADFRPPDALRVAPVPLYNGFHDVWRFVEALERHAR